jgi:hypothetical protein
MKPSFDICNKATNKPLSNLVTELTPGYLHWEFIATSFYLPVEVLKNPRYEVHPVIVIPGSEFCALYEKLLDEIPTNHKLFVTLEPGSLALLSAAKFVGFSARFDRELNAKHLLFKLWYPKQPQGVVL